MGQQEKIYIKSCLKNFYVLIFACAGSSLLYVGLLQLWSGVYLLMVCGLLTVVAPLVACSVLVAHGLSYPDACGTFPDQGSNLCPPYCKADS